MTLDGQLRNAYPAFRIFIFGLEVTDDVTRCTVNWSDDDRAPGTAEFVLANKDDKYTVTPGDLKVLYPTVDLRTAKLTPLEKLRAASVAETQRAVEQAIVGGLSIGGLSPLIVPTFEALGAAVAFREEALTSEKRDANRQSINRAMQSAEQAVRENITAVSSDEKRRVINAKFDLKQAVDQPPIDETGVGDRPVGRRELAYLSGQAYTYDFVSGAPVFHSNDPVRIFWRDPFDPKRWFFMHTGFLTDWTRSVTADREQLLTIRCEDVLRTLRYARISSNPGILDIEAIEQKEDLTFRSFFNEGFQGLTVPEVLYTLIFGPDQANTIDNLKVSEEDRVKYRNAGSVPRELRAAGDTLGETVKSFTHRFPKFGVGAFNFSKSVTFVIGKETDLPEGENSINDPPPSASVKSREVRLPGRNALAVYQSLIHHQVYPSDIDDLVLDEARNEGDWITNRSVIPASGNIEDLITFIGTNPQWYPVDAGRLFLAIPASMGGTVSRRAILRDFIQSVASQTTFSHRLTTVYDIMERIEFSFYATPKGDIIAEMPLYDFEPKDFGDRPIGADEINEALTPAVLEPKQFDPTSIRADAAGLTVLGRGLIGQSATSLPLGGLAALGPNIASESNVILTSLQDTFAQLALDQHARDIQNKIALVANQTPVSGYAENYRVQLRNTMNTDQTFADEHIRTQMKAQFNLLPGFASLGKSGDIGRWVVATLRPLIPRFGPRIESVDETTIVNSPEAARIYSELRLNQWNADAITSAVDMIPNLHLGPNRPLQVEEGEYVATTRSISHTIDWDGMDMSSTIGLNYTRQWDGQLREDGTGTPRYIPLGGFASRALNYAVLLGFDTPSESAKQREGTTGSEALPALFIDDDGSVA